MQQMCVVYNTMNNIVWCGQLLQFQLKLTSAVQYPLPLLVVHMPQLRLSKENLALIDMAKVAYGSFLL